ncbi:hypothetical protein GCM10027051_01840 [Niabella terrae]
MNRAAVTYRKTTRISLLLLWTGALLALAFMLSTWRSDAEQSGFLSKSILVDQLLLSSQDMDLGKSNALINIGLNRVMAAAAADTDTHSSVAEEKLAKKEVYRRILQQKINTLPNNAEESENEGFIIKPLPQ